jgi:predicted nucleic acid-binding protein
VIVLDASAVVELLLGLEHGAAVAGRLQAATETLHAPHLLTAEVAQVVRRFERRGDIDAPRGAAALGDLADLEVAYYDHLPLLPRVWDLRQVVSAYDALYLSLAEVLDAPLLTADASLAAAPGHRASVVALGRHT